MRKPRLRSVAWRRAAGVFLVLLAVLTAATARLLVWPAIGMPGRVSAIVVLAGPGDRLGLGVELAREHRAPVLLVSVGHLGYGGPCPASVRGAQVICFAPDPSDTRGEAEVTARLAKEQGWSSVVLVTTREQDTRARVLLGRCYGGQIYAVTTAQPWYQWPYQIAYGWGSLLKALVFKRAC